MNELMSIFIFLGMIVATFVLVPLGMYLCTRLRGVKCLRCGFQVKEWPIPWDCPKCGKWL